MGLDNPVHIVLLLIVLLLVFGAKRLPEIGRSLGEGMRGFKDALGGETQRDALPRGTTPAPPPPPDPVDAVTAEPASAEQAFGTKP
ncbi:MAG: twin-arginine translocase TatA/TatE family subunit [Solirubrobacteraceae bacterium]|jgi:sec-independent protein translocase protein TatA